MHDEKLDWYQNHDLSKKSNNLTVNDVTQLNPIAVGSILRPTKTEELIYFVNNNHAPISIGGGRFSMGGQTASPNTTHIDM